MSKLCGTSGTLDRQQEQGLGGEMKKRQLVKKGTLILNAAPFAYVLKNSLQGDLCDFCLAKSPGLKRCSGCSFVWYCNGTCQKWGWTDHKGECQNLRRVQPKVPAEAIRIIGRIIMKLQRGGDAEEGVIEPGRKRRFKDLMSHYKEIKEDCKRMEHFDTICAVLTEYLPDVVLPNEAELLGIYGRLCVNSFNILNGEMQSVATGIYLAPSVMDHSCSPNAVVTFDGPRLSVRLVQDIPQFDWSLVRISYIDQMTPGPERKRELAQRYYFNCDCPRCSGAADSVDCYRYAARCLSCSRPAVAEHWGHPPRCSCGYQCDQERSRAFWSATEYSEQQLQLMQEVNYLDACKLCLDKQGNLFHDWCLARCRVLDAAFDCCIQLQLWDRALDYGTSLLPGYQIWYGGEHPLTGILLLKMAKIRWFIGGDGAVDETSRYLRQAIIVLQSTHGRSCELFREQVLPLREQLGM